jgi:hypothetical protein
VTERAQRRRVILYSQRNPAWNNHALGWGPAHGTIGAFGCLETDFAMILTDTGHPLDPGGLDNLLTQRGLFMREPGGTFDLLASNTLDQLFPGEYVTSQSDGFDGPRIATAVASPDTYTILWISTARVATHFVVAWSPNGAQIADPWTGTVVSLAAYGGTAAVKKTIFVRHVTPKPAPPMQPAAKPAPPPPVDPAPVPTPPPYDIYSFYTGTASHPVDQVTTEADAITQAEDWSSENDSAAITVYRGDVRTGTVVFDLPAGVVPRTN